MVIRLEESMDLVITVNEAIYRGENLSQKITYITPMFVGDIDMLTANVYLTYVRTDGSADVALLERSEELYRESYCQFIIPVDCKLNKCAGDVITWLQIYTGDPSNPVIRKSGECLLVVYDSKNTDSYLCDHQITAIYQLHKNVEKELGAVSEELTQKADGLSYNEDTRELQLKSGDERVGDAVIVPSDDYAGGGGNTGDEDSSWGDMDDTGDSGGSNETWEPM